MNHEFDDALESLARHRLSDETKQRHLEVLSRLAEEDAQRRRLRRIATIAIGGALALGSAGVGTAAALGVFAEAPTDRLLAHCYATTELDDPGNHVDISIVANSAADDEGSGLAEVSASAVNLCRDLWRQGEFGSTEPTTGPPKSGSADHLVPNLVACVLPSGQVGVFPGFQDVCTTLGFPMALP